uniref:S-protein homolog n=1 Tax=Kalanchoe fedtschenkoi TaxID=63787 RepID=A0A7N0TCQ6_KALFE
MGDINIKKMLLIKTLICLCLSIGSAESSADLEWPKTHVRLFDKAESQSDITVHCWSSEDDLGVHTIRFGEFYAFNFRHNLLCNTKFVCQVKFADGVDKFFHAYHCQRDRFKCREMCDWSLYENRACLWDSDCYDYSKTPPL